MKRDSYKQQNKNRISTQQAIITTSLKKNTMSKKEKKNKMLHRHDEHDSKWNTWQTHIQKKKQQRGEKRECWMDNNK